MEQAAQIVGAVLILAAYMAVQAHRLSVDSVAFLAMNTLGAGILAVLAAVDRDAGFLLLEAVWALVSARGLVRAVWRPVPPG